MRQNAHNFQTQLRPQRAHHTLLKRTSNANRTLITSSALAKLPHSLSPALQHFYGDSSTYTPSRPCDNSCANECKSGKRKSTRYHAYTFVHAVVERVFIAVARVVCSFDLVFPRASNTTILRVRIPTLVHTSVIVNLDSTIRHFSFTALNF